MLAYVFWHWRRPDVPAVSYEALQRRFHAALGEAPPPGFLGSRSLAIAGAPWAGGGSEAYEDWYLLEGSAALDPLNAAAVSASRQAPHDAAAAVAGGGTAGLYLLRLGSAGETPGTATWFAKPAGLTYAAMFATIEPLVRTEGAALWGRQMTLGPALEFCLHASRPVELPAPLVPVPIHCRRSGPSPGGVPLGGPRGLETPLRDPATRPQSGHRVRFRRAGTPAPRPPDREPAVSSYKFEQRRLIHRGREFHFVSYDAQIANERRGEVAMPPMWYLMNEGKRRPVMEQVPGMAIEDLDRALLAWVEAEIYSAVGPRRAV